MFVFLLFFLVFGLHLTASSTFYTWPLPTLLPVPRLLFRAVLWTHLFICFFLVEHPFGFLDKCILFYWNKCALITQRPCLPSEGGAFLRNRSVSHITSLYREGYVCMCWRNETDRVCWMIQSFSSDISVHGGRKKQKVKCLPSFSVDLLEVQVPEEYVLWGQLQLEALISETRWQW